MRTIARFVLVLAPLTALSGCNSGVFTLWSASSDSGGSTTVATTVSNVTVSDWRNSPAEIGFTLTGQTVDAVHIEYLLPPAGDGDPTEPVPIATLGTGDVNISSSGGANQFDWAFSGDLGAGFVDGLAVRVRLESGASATTSGPISVGNSPPVISPFSFPASEVIGVVGMLFTVSDTDDTVSLAVEVNADAGNGFPAGSWETALPDLGQELVPFSAAESGTTVPFHWDVVGQYGPLDSEVMVRATAVDTADPGEEPLQHQVEGGSLLLVDNNAPPVVSLDDFSFALSDDQRLGIVVPYTVSDAEGDTPDLVFQWTREGEPFVDLPDHEALIDEIRSDPALREAFRIATPYPMPIRGMARPTGEADTVELPELGSSQSHLLRYAGQPGGDLSSALDGYELELLRSAGIPEPLAPTWLDNPLDGPVAALPTTELTTAYVLDGAGATWRVREIDLATGAVLEELANGIGTPDTMTLERGGAALLVAAHDFNVSVWRVDLDTLDVRAIFDGSGPLPGDTIRGLASLGAEVALATLGDELVRLNYADPSATTIVTLLDDLATPWGLVADPLRTNHVYLAERDFAGGGRVLSLALDTLVVDTLPADAPGLPHPEALAVERSRLLVLTDETPSDGTKELRALELGSRMVSVLTTELPQLATGLTAGPDDLRLLILTNGDDLAAGGGVVQRRTIVAYDPTRRVATVDVAFAPPLSSGQYWRARSTAGLVLEAGVPRTAAFVWDSRDMSGGQGRALLRLTARDADASIVEHDGGRQILSGLAGLPLSLGGPATTGDPRSMTAADLDGDGDLDLVSANTASDTLTVFFQSGAGVFDPVPSLTLGSPATTVGPNGVAAADLDGDGDLDLVSSNGGIFGSGNTLTVFFQTGAGVFDPLPSLILGGPGTTDGPTSVAAADLDGDGDLDIVATASSALAVFFQTGAGVFDPLPSLTLGSPQTTAGARSVATADLDGDGDLDIVATIGNAHAVFFQTGAGVFDPLPSLTLDAIGTANLAAADLDGDGDVDLVSANLTESTLTVFFQTEAGVFDSLPSLTLGDPATVELPVSVDVGDLDGDGDLDLVSANLGGDTLTVFLQTGAGVFDTLPALTLGDSKTTNAPLAVALVDLDGDGNTDVVSSNSFSANLAVFYQTGAGVFGPVPSQTLGDGVGSGAGYPCGVAAADLDGDGDLDIASANLGFGPMASSSLTVFYQTATGVFDALPSLILGDPGAFGGDPGTTDGSVAVAAADLDGDGDVDLVTANGFDLPSGGGSVDLGSDTLTVFFQTGAGVFDALPSLILGGPTVTDGAIDLATADLDGDGDVDLVSANAFSGSLTVYFQMGPGVFGPVPSLTLGGPGTTQGAASVAAADLDGDGDLDLVSANGFDLVEDDVIVDAASDTLTVFFQTAPGVFDPVPSLTLGGPLATDGAVSVAAADVDGDGDLDLISANALGDTLTVFFQTEAGVFDTVPSLTLDSPMASESPKSVTAADLDGDGDLDLVTMNPGGGSPGGGDNNNAVTVFFQRRAGVFDSVTLPLSDLPTIPTEQAVSAAVADLDGDGDVDIISANGSSANLTVFYGTHKP